MCGDRVHSTKAETRLGQWMEFRKVMHFQRTAKQPECWLHAVLAAKPQNPH